MLNRSPVVRARGFSLVELMVALVVGLIVIGAVLALILSIMRANNQNIQVTRLTQELRATSAVITSDIKRANGVADPLAEAKLAAANKLAGAPSVPTSTCVRYGYMRESGGTYAATYRAISLSGGKVMLDEAATAANATCGAGVQISSDQVTINDLTFVLAGRRIDITIEGSLDNANPDVAAIRRQVSQTIFVRSVAG